MPAKKPSTSTEPWLRPSIRPASPSRIPAAKIRLRSACERRTLSYSGRKRTGAGIGLIGPRSIRQVEELAAALVAERHEPRPQPLEHGGEPGEPRPRRDVGRRRGAERPEVAQDDVVQRRPRRAAGRATTPPSRTLAARSSPEAARRHLHQRELAPAGVRERAASSPGTAPPAPPAAARDSGRSASSRRASWSTGARSTPRSTGPNSGCRPSSASSTGCMSGRARGSPPRSRGGSSSA